MATAKKAPVKATATFSTEERAAMREAAREAKRGKNFDGEAEVLAKIAEMDEPDRKMAERIHAIVKRVAPELTSKTWYGMPAYVNAAGKTICFFQPAAKFKTRYGTLGFQDAAQLDDGNVWPNAYAITRLTADDEARIAALVKQAVG
jgi:uncharacterized protein YdhG (YjbR/CyaY superfamily)